jgi:hypothetical protein
MSSKSKAARCKPFRRTGKILSLRQGGPMEGPVWDAVGQSGYKLNQSAKRHDGGRK